jgi:hypothetical protein
VYLNGFVSFQDVIVPSQESVVNSLSGFVPKPGWFSTRFGVWGMVKFMAQSLVYDFNPESVGGGEEGEGASPNQNRLVFRESWSYWRGWVFSPNQDYRVHGLDDFIGQEGPMPMWRLCPLLGPLYTIV